MIIQLFYKVCFIYLMSFQFCIDRDFEASRGIEDIRNVYRREGLDFRYIGRIHNKRRFVFIPKCKCVNGKYSVNPLSLSDYMTPEEYQNVILEHENGDQLSKVKLKYNPFAKYPA